MESRKRSIYVTTRQKKKLIELLTKHPELISCKVTQDFNYKDSQKLWQNISSQLNAVPGARKTWRQWRKTWHDMKSKTKKRQAEKNGQLPNITYILTEAEQEILGIKNSNCQEPSEFLQVEEEFVSEDQETETLENDASVASMSEPDSPPEQKVFNRTKCSNGAPDIVSNSTHLDNCYFNCDILASQERKKIKFKEEYLNFKKDYLRQKLKLMKEQTEALKSIAKELSKC